MSELFLGEIMMFAGDFAPEGWALCNGQPLPIAQNDALFKLIGTTFGGDGTTTFNLPDIRSRVPIHAGHGKGLSSYGLGDTGGAEQVSLTVAQMPTHTHLAMAAADATGQVPTPAGGFWSNPPAKDFAIYHNLDYVTPMNPLPPLEPMAPTIVEPTGGSRPHENRQPYLAFSFCIALFGDFPRQS